MKRLKFIDYVKSEITGSYFSNKTQDEFMMKKEEMYDFVQVPIKLEQVSFF